MIEARDKGKRARARQPAVGRLQAKDAAERRRHPDRAVGVGSQRDRNQRAADRTARAAGGAAGHPRRIVRIARRAVMHILAGEIVGVFAHVERADQHGALRLHALDQRGVARRRREIAVDLRSGAGGKTFYVEQVLDRERHAGERPDLLAGGDRGIDRAGFCTRAVGGDVGERIQHGIVFGDPRQARLRSHRARTACGRLRPARFVGPTARRCSRSWRYQAV